MKLHMFTRIRHSGAPHAGNDHAALASEASAQRGKIIVRAPDTRPEPLVGARAASPRNDADMIRTLETLI
jgi:hypothetical protein